MIASAAKEGGTKIIDVFALVCSTASSTVLKTGILLSNVVLPPLPGVTPETMLVPYASI